MLEGRETVASRGRKQRHETKKLAIEPKYETTPHKRGR